MYANDATSAVSGKAFLLRADLEGIILPYVTDELQKDTPSKSHPRRPRGS